MAKQVNNLSSGRVVMLDKGVLPLSTFGVKGTGKPRAVTTTRSDYANT